MAVPDRRPSPLYSGGSQIAVGEDKSAHLRVPGTQGPRWVLALTTHKMLFFLWI